MRRTSNSRHTLREALDRLMGYGLPWEQLLPGDVKVNAKILDALLVDDEEVARISKKILDANLEAPTSLYAAVMYLFLRTHASVYKVVGKKASKKKEGIPVS